MQNYIYRFISKCSGLWHRVVLRQDLATNRNTSRRYKPEDSIMNLHSRENLKSRIVSVRAVPFLHAAAFRFKIMNWDICSDSQSLHQPLAVA
jgi:hypothetical protein